MPSQRNARARLQNKKEPDIFIPGKRVKHAELKPQAIAEEPP